jgi:hypothetical protein
MFVYVKTLRNVLEYCLDRVMSGIIATSEDTCHIVDHRGQHLPQYAQEWFLLPTRLQFPLMFVHGT